MNDSREYTQKKALFEKMLTIYGRNAVYEALLDPGTLPFRLHLSTSNKPIEIIDSLKKLATKRGVEILYHDKKELSRISKNSKQDQGVALDIEMQSFMEMDTFLQIHGDNYRILAVDNVENPQNLGMIIRSACAGNIDALLLAKKGNATLNPLVIKASAGTLFRMPILRVDNLEASLKILQTQGAIVHTLSLRATQSYQEVHYAPKSIFIVGNESRGVSEAIEALSDHHIIIPMHRGVESLNVAVVASLLAFLD